MVDCLLGSLSIASFLVSENDTFFFSEALLLVLSCFLVNDSDLFASSFFYSSFFYSSLFRDSYLIVSYLSVTYFSAFVLKILVNESRTDFFLSVEVEGFAGSVLVGVFGVVDAGGLAGAVVGGLAGFVVVAGVVGGFAGLAGEVAGAG